MPYKTGEIFRYAGEDNHSRNADKEFYVLIQVTSSKVALIGLTSWNRWANPANVNKKNEEITDKEFMKICNGEIFKKVNRKVITVRNRR